MALEHLRQIREKEEQAEKIRQNGLTESARIIKAAQDEAEAVIAKAHLEADWHYEEAITKANEEAKEDSEMILHHATWECEMLSETAKKNRDEAISQIVRRVVDPWQ